MKKNILVSIFIVGSLVSVQAQISLPTIESIKKEETVLKTEAVNQAKSTVSGFNAATLISYIGTKVKLTADQVGKIQSVASKVNLSNLSNPKDQLKSLLGNVDFNKIFSADQLKKLKS